mmetsp:Transcript_68059/g.175421  ORF Transcript_68059/g.175421 Transcript_68059/m.175421 type:complete len:206 (-) Transcript_68059:451-1068(-)
MIERLPREQHVGDSPDGPHVGLLRVRSAQHLGRAELRVAALGRHGRHAVPFGGKAEVDELDNGAADLGEEDALELEVSVHDVALVQVVHCLEYLAQRALRLLLREPPALPEHAAQVAAFEELHDHVHGEAFHVDLLHLDDVLVVEAPVNIHARGYDFAEVRADGEGAAAFHCDTAARLCAPRLPHDSARGPVFVFALGGKDVVVP